MKSIMANCIKSALLLIIATLMFNTTYAQTAKKDRETKKQAEIKSLVDAKSYVFKAQYAQPMRGGQRYLTSEYDLRVGQDSLIAYLPYFGRAYVAPIYPEDAGMMFTATKFDYTITENKNGWDIAFNPKDAKDVRNIRMNISKDGYATLSITSQNRDLITYQGYIEQKKQKV
jgi:hypothetical protein